MNGVTAHALSRLTTHDSRAHAASDPDRPILIKTMVGTTLVFLVLAGPPAASSVAKGRIGLGGFVGVLAAGLVLAARRCIVIALTGLAAGGVVQMLTGAGNLPPAPSFSYQEALVMQGKHGRGGGIVPEPICVQYPPDLEVRLALGDASGRAGEDVRARRSGNFWRCGPAGRRRSRT